MRKIAFLLIGMVFILSSCQQKNIYSHFYSIPTEGWHADSVMDYSIEIEDSVMNHEVLIVLRHTSQYPYQNLWLFVDEYVGDRCVHHDTIEAQMADEYGRWLGSGLKTYELPLLYDEHYRFGHSGAHSFKLRQGMRTEWLKGITDVGVVVKVRY